MVTQMHRFHGYEEGAIGGEHSKDLARPVQTDASAACDNAKGMVKLQ